MGSKRYFSLLVFLCLVIIPYSSAATLGVNKLEVNFENVLRSGYAENSVVISTGSPNNIEVYYEARGEIAEWIRFAPESQPVIMNQDTPQRITIIVEPPQDARVDEYEGMIVLLTGPLGEQTGSMGTNIVVAFEIKVKVLITDTQILNCVAGGFSINDVEIGNSLPFTANVQNSGNVRIRPGFEIKVYDKEQTTEVSFFQFTSRSEILPTITGSVSEMISHDLQPGQYWAEVSEPVCDSTSLITFSVLERGGISDMGELVRINNNPWASTQEIVPIEVQFRNLGERTVSAQFKGTISRDEKIVQVVNSEIIDVSPGELVPLQVFFEPERPGQYKITGRVFYNNKITYEKGSVLNVNPGENYSPDSNVLLYTIILAIIAIIIIFLLLIIKKKKRRRKKIF